MTDTEVLPNSWCNTKLSEITTVNPTLDKTGIPDNLEVSFVPMPAVQAENGIIDISEIRKFSEVKKGYTPFREGDVLFAKITPCMENGKMAVVPEVRNGLGFGSTEFHVLRSLSGVIAKYVYYFVSSQAFRRLAEHNMSGAVGQRRVTTPYLSASEVPLPPTNEQHRIVAKIEELFSELDSGVESLKTAQAQLKVYRQSLLKHAFEGKLTAQWREQNKDKLEFAEALLARIQTERANHYQQQLKEWEAAGKAGNKPKAPKPLPSLTAEELDELPELPEGWGWELIGRFAEVKGGKRLPAGADYTEHQTNYPYIRVVDFENLGVRKTDLKYLSEETQARISAYTISSKDTYISIAGTIGRVGTIPDSLDGANLTENAAKICEQCLVDKKYLALWLHSVGGNAQLVEKTISTTQPKLALFRIEKVSVPVCSIAEQALIVQHIESRFSEIDQLELTITTSLRRAEALRQSILEKAFSGQLVPQNPNDEPASILLARIKAEKAAQPKSKKVPA